VITDLSMPHLTGERLAAEIIKIRKDIPVVIATGFVGAADNEEIKKSGVRGVIAKPYNMQELAKSIRSILDGT
jgi:DNA-binding NarL/FixJ family response regulator